ncbi:hypothetical protein BVY00_00295 [bacterium G20]|nr:hypothetical protein BVY00_00295 [bacterium G20]
MLAYKPNKFFNYLDELERQTGASRNTLRVTIDRAKRAGLITIDPKTGRPQTTWRGKMKAAVRPQKKMKHYLVIVFDIPERMRKERNLLRDYLKGTYAEPVQKSVWKTQYDIHEELNEVIDELRIKQYVTQFMADEI